MKFMTKLSMIVAGVILFFAPCAFGVSTGNAQPAVGSVPSQTITRGMPSFFTLIVDRDHGHSNNNNGNNGCGNQGGNGWGNGWWWDGNGKDSNCQSVPEGGSSLMYLFLASLACFGALLIQSLRKPSAADPLEESAQTKQS
jgi:hypothetical protein